MTYGELYKIGNTYECLDFKCRWGEVADIWHKCEIIDVNYTKTGKVKATVKNCRNQVFFATARKASVIVGESKWHYLEYEPESGVCPNWTRTFRNLTINN